MKNSIVFMLLLIISYSTFGQESLKSPNGRIQVSVATEENLELEVILNGEELVETIRPALKFSNGKVFGVKDKLKRVKQSQVNEEIRAVVPTKSSIINDHYVQKTFVFKDFNFEVRAYNNGVAYRFFSKLQGETEVVDEQIDIVLAEEYQTYLPEEQQLISHFENYYEKVPVSKIEVGTIANLPVLFTDEDGISVSITESDVYDYPNLFLKKKEGKAFQSLFPKVVLSTKELKEGQDRLEAIKEAAPFIAKVKGERSFPWRVFMISEEDKEIVENNLVYQLASPLKLKDTSWIEPGKVAWDWWNANNVYGVDFKSGINTETYKYYIDFASKFGLEYIILDEGWSKSTLNVMEPNPNIDMEQLIDYAREKEVGIILWSLWRPLDENMDSLLNQYEEWGIKGVKVDFIQRADQYVVNFYERLAAKAAQHNMLVDFHGSFKPSGMRRAYPNIINYEGVKGLENSKWENKITPEHNLTLPFARMTAGIMDYTPGGMDNANEKNFAVRFERAMTMGTRAHQIAMYVVYESPLQMLSDSPSNYYREKESTSFISRIPTIWDETQVLEAKISDYILLTRKNDDKWYIGGMTDEKERNFKIDFSFLDAGKEYVIEWIEDGENSDRVAKDFKTGTREIDSTSEMKIEMNSGGGWVGIVKEKF